MNEFFDGSTSNQRKREIGKISSYFKQINNSKYFIIVGSGYPVTPFKWLRKVPCAILGLWISL